MNANSVLESGVVYGHYAIDSVLESRDDGETYLARHTQRATWHALKVVDHLDARKRMRLEREAVFRDELRHPNIVPATECIDVGGRPALVMEFVEGPTMRSWLDEDVRPLTDKLALFRGIVEGVRFAHAMQVVHRALTPSHVVLQPGPGDTWIPRIYDFGLAKAKNPEMGKYGGLTTINTSLGPSGYAAPEQSRDAASVEESADLYALGCILYELVCGVAPFTGMSAFDALTSKTRESYPPPAHVAPGMPNELYSLLHRMLAADASDRPSCDSVLSELDRVYERVVASHTPRIPAGRKASTSTWNVDLEEQVDLQSVLILCCIPLCGLVLGLVVVFAP